MALSILDGTQTATTLSTILSSGQHITAHTVVSLGTQAITDMRGAVSGSVVSISNFPATQPVSIASVTVGNTVTIAGTVTANPTGTQTIAGTVTANVDAGYLTVALNDFGASYSQAFPVGIDQTGFGNGTVPISGTVTIGSALPAGTNRIGVVTIGAGTVTIGAGTAQIGSVTASISNSVTIGSLPLIAGTVSIGIQQSDDTDPNIKFLPIGFAQSDSGGQLDQWTGVKQTNPLPVYFPSTYPIPAGTNRIGVVTIGGGTVTIGAGISQIGSVTASISSFTTSVTARLINPAGTAVTYAEVGTAGNPSIDVLSVQGVSGGTSLLIGGTTGSFTTRFGSVTTANTAQISTAVTNLSRKYLFVQNVTTSSNVITVGIGFTPTTTQGIQLAAGALIDFESSFIPTGAVYILSSVTGSPFTILEA